MKNSTRILNSQIVRTLLELGVLLVVQGLTWIIVEVLMGYPWQLAALVGYILAVALGALLRGLKIGEYDGIKVLIFLALLILVWGRHSILAPDSKITWTIALIAIPLATYAIGRVISKRRNVGQSVA